MGSMCVHTKRRHDEPKAMSIRYEHYDNDETYDDANEGARPDREISLGTATVLGIFLALAMVCALFFGFGYSMGRRSVPSALANINTGISAPLPENKLTPGSLAPLHTSSGAPAENPAEAADADNAAGAKTTSVQKIKPGAATVAAGDAAAETPQAVQHESVTRAVAQATEQKPLPSRADDAAATSSISAGGTSYVQVAAISVTHKEDAEMLKGSLQRRGYAVAIHQGTQDQLLHVQIGPLASKKDAEAMKARLLSDGYNAIVK